MEELKHHITSRRAYRNHLKKLVSKVTEITELFDSNSSSKPDSTTLTDLREQLVRKQTILTELDNKISALITDEDELEREIIESEDYCSLMATNIARIARLLEACRISEPSVDRPPPPVSTESRDPIDSRATSGDSRRDLAAVHPKPQDITRLPKLTIPVFSGDILNWQSFWDCFETAVHDNTALSGVQKLNYLRAQLQGGALRVITGLPLINDSYIDSVALLKDRYGQPHKLINAHMKALIDLSGPNSSLNSLQLFYDAIEAHTRSLASLGKPISEYAAMLVTSILGKLPMDIKRNLARAHGTDDWTYEDLRKAIRSEIQILEMGTGDITKHQTPMHPPTASFMTNTDRKASQRTQGFSERKVMTPTCVFCNGPHTPTNCHTVRDPKQLLGIVRQNKLCFNCLGRH